MFTSSQFLQDAVTVKGMTAVQFQYFLGQIDLLITNSTRKYFLFVALTFQSYLTPFRVDFDS